MILYGKNSVFERLKTNPKSVQKVFMGRGFDFRTIEKTIKSNNIPIERVSLHRLAQLKRAENNQGIMAEVNDFNYVSFDALLSQSREKLPIFIFLDRVYDPQNLGAIIRTTACFGGFCLVIPKHKACSVTETVLHVASGGENYVSVAMVGNLSNAIINAKKNGFWIVGALADDKSEDLSRVDLPFPLGIVLGSEGEGLRYGVEKHLDIKAHVPMGANISFNVTIACAIFCYEAIKQKYLKKA